MSASRVSTVCSLYMNPFDAEEATTRVAATKFVRQPIELHWNVETQPRSLEIDNDIEIGSSPGTAVCIQDRTVSRIHARIEFRLDGPWVVDLDSTNGTFVNSTRVSGARLHDGALLRLGDVQLLVRVGEARDRSVWPQESFGPLVGRSASMRALFALLHDYAQTSSTVLISGETGTGKDVVARAIHQASERSNAPFIVVDCGAIPESLVESELFGHTRGAFSGAVRAHQGSFGAAHGGTLFLDEIGELPLSVQPKLLRALETGEIRRVGEAEHRATDVRVVAATHRDLAAMVSAGAFREDLYFRLAVLPVSIPPLRERREDIRLLVEHFLAGADPLLPDVMADVENMPWLGNARELRNFVQRARALGGRRALDSMPGPARQRRIPSVDLDEPFKDARERCIDHLERTYLEGWLARKQWNVSAVAEAMGVDRSYVHRLMKKHGLSRA